jgi:hypothetical protein
MQRTRTVTSPGFAAEIRMVWRAFLRALRDPYRPERFYMRGPGPRWRAKNGLATA